MGHTLPQRFVKYGDRSLGFRNTISLEEGGGKASAPAGAALGPLRASGIGSKSKSFRNQESSQNPERRLHREREKRGGNCAFENQAQVIEANAGEDRLSQSSRTNQGPQGRGADVDDGRSLDAGEDRRRCERKLHLPQPGGGREPQHVRRLQ